MSRLAVGEEIDDNVDDNDSTAGWLTSRNSTAHITFGRDGSIHSPQQQIPTLLVSGLLRRNQHVPPANAHGPSESEGENRSDDGGGGDSHSSSESSDTRFLMQRTYRNSSRHRNLQGGIRTNRVSANDQDGDDGDDEQSSASNSDGVLVAADGGENEDVVVPPRNNGWSSDSSDDRFLMGNNTTRRRAADRPPPEQQQHHHAFNDIRAQAVQQLEAAHTELQEGSSALRDIRETSRRMLELTQNLRNDILAMYRLRRRASGAGYQTDPGDGWSDGEARDQESLDGFLQWEHTVTVLEQHGDANDDDDDSKRPAVGEILPQVEGDPWDYDEQEDDRSASSSDADDDQDSEFSSRSAASLARAERRRRARLRQQEVEEERQ